MTARKPSTNVLLSHAFSFQLDPNAPNLQPSNGGSLNLRGQHYEMLEVKGLDLEIAGANCSMGFYLVYHPDSTTAFRTGRLIAR